MRPEKLTKEEKAAKALSKVRMARPIDIFSLYCHVSNSGVTFKIVDEGFGPTFVVESSAFGNIASSQKFYLDRAAFVALGDLLVAASNFEFSEEYCNAAAADHSVYLGKRVEYAEYGIDGETSSEDYISDEAYKALIADKADDFIKSLRLNGSEKIASRKKKKTKPRKKRR